MRLRYLPFVCLPLCLGGCGLWNSLFGGGTMPSTYSSASAYTGMDHKSLAIVIVAPRATMDEYVGTREEITSFIVAQMRANMPTTEIISPRDVMNFQDDTLNWKSMPERDIGRHFSADKALFVEVLDYSTRPAIGYANMQGHLRAMCHIVDCEADSPANVPPVWKGVIDARWPPERPLDANQNNDTAVRLRVLESFADRLVRCFYTAGNAGPGSDIPG